MKNVKQVRDELEKVFKSVKAGDIDNSTAKNLVAATNAMLKSAQLELEHSKLVGSIKKIKFLETE